MYFERTLVKYDQHIPYTNTNINTVHKHKHSTQTHALHEHILYTQTHALYEHMPYYFIQFKDIQ